MQTRRQFLEAAAATALGAAAGCRSEPAKFDPQVFRRPPTSRVAVLKAESYETDLVDPIVRGLGLFDVNPRGQRVVLKPNIVEFDPSGVINTHPRVIEAAIEAFLRLGAREVIVAEGPGHRRDNEYLLTASGMADVLRERRVRYVDLNFDAVRAVPLRSRFSSLGELYFPRTVLEADLLVSMPKLKTHHWVGVTLAMKNLFGIVPSSIYGWPKNVLHWAGLDNSILDINSTLPVPSFALVDGVVGMEGNGPIQGAAKPAGVLVMGSDFVAVDATCARLMRIDPSKVSYLAQAGEFLGHVEEPKIEQVGEAVAALSRDFKVLPRFDALKIVEG
jgi:uncharacterized protein (DUF362 family)